ncbi:Glutamine cyclotransferase [Flagellimonas flava]|uniref:Glutamine cyclotransferase n=2 Tax=Flagellimonas flava TaxID=570519 RepID=A0A1M5IAY3_9FLAO|nr:Glutamine cyclotransferase [Allomuricauda flava]
MVKILTIFSFLLFFLGCGETDPSKLFAIQLEGKGNKFQNNQEIGITIRNKKEVDISEPKYFIDGQELAVVNGKVRLTSNTLGSKTLVAKIGFGEQTVEIEKKIKLLAANAPVVYTYDIVNTFPHDPTAYTQGLEFHDNILYESTGKKGFSTLRKVNFETGEITQKIDMDASVFAEGITLLNDQLYQLTWQSGMGYVYKPENLERIKSFSYDQSREGWGLCNDGTKIFKSDGTEKIWFLDPETLEEQGYIETVTNKSIFNKANELEYLNGKIYANVYQKESIMIIDASTGAIEGVINFGGLKNKIKKGPNWDEGNSVLNGVAYHHERGTFFVTGKNWNKLFEVNIRKKD